MSPRPPLPVGTFGSISVSNVGEARYKARARYRGQDGTIRTIARFGQTKSAAERALKAALGELQRDGDLTGATTVTRLAETWLAEVEGSNRAANTKRVYALAVANYIRPELGALRIREATTRRCDAALTRIKAKHGAGAAKTARSVLNGMFSLAVRHDLVTVSPVRETSPISQAKRKPRALTRDEEDTLRDLLRADQRAVTLDLPDLVEWMLYTGMRIGEATAVRESVLTGESVTVNATVVRVTGRGAVIQERPKSAAGVRTLPLPSLAAAMLERRRTELRLSTGPVLFLNDRGDFRSEDDPGVMFPAPLRRSLRDPSNTAGDLRETVERIGCPKCDGQGWHPHLKTARENRNAPDVPVCDGMPPFAWVTFHAFRKTVATRLEEAGFTPRQVADFMGHSQPSMTLNVYFSRDAVDPGMATALDR